MEFEHKLNKHTFKVVCDKEQILSEIEKDRTNFKKDMYQSYYTVGYEDGYLNEEEYNSNLDEMVKLLNDLTSESKMIELIQAAQKKKNGTFYKNRIVFREGCDNTEFITEWHNTWIYKALSVSPLNDTTLEISYIKITDTPA